MGGLELFYAPNLTNGLVLAVDRAGNLCLLGNFSN
jgi:hypothetical protein